MWARSSVSWDEQAARQFIPVWHRERVLNTSEYIVFIAFYTELLWKKEDFCDDSKSKQFASV